MRVSRADWMLVALAIVGAVLLAWRLDVWLPLVDYPFFADRDQVEADARAFLETEGIDTSQHEAMTRFYIGEDVLTYLTEEVGADGCNAVVREAGVGVTHVVELKRSGYAHDMSVRVLPGAGVVGWSRSRRSFEPSDELDQEQRKDTARRAAARTLHGADPVWESAGDAIDNRPARDVENAPTESYFADRRPVANRSGPKLERTTRMRGDQLRSVWTNVHLPVQASAAAKQRERNQRGLTIFGQLWVLAGVLVALVIALRGLRRGRRDVGFAAGVAVLGAGSAYAASAVDGLSAFRAWSAEDPRWISTAERMVEIAPWFLQWGLLLFVVCLAAANVERGADPKRLGSLRALMRGQLSERGIAAASVRGVLVGAVCALAAVFALEWLDLVTGTAVQLQPTSIMTWSLPRDHPLLYSAVYFPGVALVEELGYRAFGTELVLRVTRRRWLAVLAPAVVFGLVHAQLSFLPPADPWWARAVVVTVAGVVLGLAYLRFGALTVIVAHYTLDLFLVNRPFLESPEPRHVLGCAGALLVPLVPAAVVFAVRTVRRRRGGVSTGAGDAS